MERNHVEGNFAVPTEQICCLLSYHTYTLSFSHIQTYIHSYINRHTYGNITSSVDTIKYTVFKTEQS